MRNISHPCPQCGGKGKKVNLITLESLLKPEPARGISDTQYRFCDALNCDTVYFGENGQTFAKDDLTIRVGVKELDAPRPICYCFGHTIESVEAEIKESGQSTVLEDIKTRMEKGCWCETKSAMGGCCLGTVGKYVKMAMTEHGNTSDANLPIEEQVDCCATHCKETVPDKNKKQKGSILAIGGSLIAAIAASACCWLPLLLIGFGLSAGGVSPWLEEYRPIFLSVAGLLLALGFYLVYRPALTCESGSACEVPRPKLKRFNQVAIWFAAILVVAFALFPSYGGKLISTKNGPSTVNQAATSGKMITMAIDGMTCEACAAGLKYQLEKTPGVTFATVNYDTGNAKVTLTLQNPAPLEVLKQVISDAGYKVK